MATASSSGLSSLGRKKKAPGLMDQIGNFFGGDKKRKSKGSFRGLSSSPARPAKAAPKGGENAVVRLFRTIVSPAPPKSRWTAMTAKLGLGSQKSTGSAKAKKAGAGDSGTLSKIFKMGASRTGSLPKK
ncbi:myelin basic protein-like isoform 1-T1 [Salvelinus alpinus]|uniref:Myelin basic protein n=2 Tax=Salmonidae TaxID=8015 RepID=A0A1S3RU36_SALSA|nr:myelin basic protein-like isoform X2 [Salmo salar]XP_029591890.1 myelin basic protein-like isoform X1 [Salmo trutta]XP_041727571.1 myelin basic protein isoform X1 [Coregonus clupeaformis]XP_041727693.1 myelin basic protein-like isoform X1 [Coregonus clupeaformis]XP_055782285.1 myelin basic protein-like isoform X1 [Salvelinus fontinalis]|eukprot:XP_014055815.1 PREDICTED: myelin basic protein-like isoform X1 [Salmo salar]